MQDKLLALWRRIEPRLRPIVFFVFLAMLFAEIALWQQDASSGVEPGDIKRPVVKVEDFASPDIKKLETLAATTPPEIEKTDFRWLIVTDMFNVQEVKNAVVQERQANDLFTQAQDLFRNGQLREALQSCQKALEIRPDHSGARQLKDRLEKQIQQDQKRRDRLF